MRDALGKAGLSCADYQSVAKNDREFGTENATDVGKCELDSETIELAVWKDRGQVDNWMGFSKTLGCTIGKGFGLSSFDYVAGDSWVISNLSQTLAKKISDAVGGTPHHIDLSSCSEQQPTVADSQPRIATETATQTVTVTPTRTPSSASSPVASAAPRTPDPGLAEILDVDPKGYEISELPGHYLFEYSSSPRRECHVFPEGVSCDTYAPEGTPPVTNGPFTGPPNVVRIMPPAGPELVIDEGGRFRGKPMLPDRRISVGVFSCRTLPADGVECTDQSVSFRIEDGVLTGRYWD